MNYYDGYGVGYADATDKYMSEVARLRCVLNTIFVAPELQEHPKLRGWIRAEAKKNTAQDSPEENDNG